MKKIYNKPTSKVFEVENEEVLSGSDPNNSIRYGGSNANGGPTVAEGDDYRSNIWGD